MGIKINLKYLLNSKQYTFLYFVRRESYFVYNAVDEKKEDIKTASALAEETTPYVFQERVLMTKCNCKNCNMS